MRKSMNKTIGGKFANVGAMNMCFKIAEKLCQIDKEKSNAFCSEIRKQKALGYVTTEDVEAIAAKYI